MGIMSSKDPKTENFDSKSSSRNERIPTVNSPINWEDPASATKILMLKEMYALFPSKLEGDSEEKVAELSKQFLEFVKGGNCKELGVALQDCCKKSEVKEECSEAFLKLWGCMSSHPNYYHPFIAAVDNVVEEISKHGYKVQSPGINE